MRIYEGMFLLDPALASDWSSAEAEVSRVLERAEAKVLGIRNWDERKLAYAIGRHKRGFYALSYFEAAPERIADIERDVLLSEKMLRALFIRRETMTEEEIAKSLAADPPKAYSRFEDRGGRWEDRGPRGGQRSGRAPRSERDEATAAVAATKKDVNQTDDDAGSKEASKPEDTE